MCEFRFAPSVKSEELCGLLHTFYQLSGRLSLCTCNGVPGKHASHVQAVCAFLSHCSALGI